MKKLKVIDNIQYYIYKQNKLKKYIFFKVSADFIMSTQKVQDMDKIIHRKKHKERIFVLLT